LLVFNSSNTIEPYPPRAGEPTQICVELRNPTSVSQTVWVEFAWADFGIGLPFHPFHGQQVTLPPHSIVKKCTTWVPPFAGHFCAQIRLIDPQQCYADQVSQRNMDVNEILMPGVEVPFIFPVHNPNPYSTVITMSAMRVDSFFDVFFDVFTFPLRPGETHTVTAFVTRHPGTMPEPGTVVADIEAQFRNDQGQQMLLGGIRKEFHPPIPIHRPGEPPYSESEISVNPYPPRE
jgi:hypothetical protein